MNFAEAGQKIRASRLAAGLSQAALAKELRMSRTTISQIETGVIGEIGVRKLALLCDRLGLQLRIEAPTRERPTLQDLYAQNRQQRNAALAQVQTALKPGRPSFD